MEFVANYFILILPLIILELVLKVSAIVSIIRHNNFKCGNRNIWILVVLLISTIGPILYFAIGREDE